MIDKDRPVWVTGRLVKRTRRALKILALDKQDNARMAIFPCQYVEAEEKMEGVEEWRYKVPAWQAFQNKLVWSEV